MHRSSCFHRQAVCFYQRSFKPISELPISGLDNLFKCLFIIASLFTQKARVCTYSKYCKTSPYTVNHWLHVWISVGLIIRSARHLRVWRRVCYMMLHGASLGLVLLSAYQCGIRAANHSRDCKQVDQWRGC